MLILKENITISNFNAIRHENELQNRGALFFITRAISLVNNEMS